MAMQPTPTPFIWGRGGVAMTPEDVAKLREMAALSLDRSADTSPVGHWSAGLSRVVDALGGVMKERKADRAEAEGRASADEFVQQSPVLSAMLGGQSGALPAAMPQGGMPSGDTAAAVRAGLIQRGMPEHVADGFVMNFQDESGLNPGINEAAPIVPGSRGGFGLAQWTGPRRVALEKFAEARGVPPSDLDAQLDFLMTELQGPEAGAAQAIFGAGDAGSAAAAVASEFLRPAPEHLNRRVAKYTGGQYQSGQAPGEVIAALSGAAANPWVQKQYGPAIEALMGQQSAMQGAQYEAQLKQQDPAYQIALQQAQLELEQTRNPPPAKPLEVGGVLLDPTTYEPIFDSRQSGPGKAPQVETFYDPATGLPYKAQWDDATGAWQQVGGVEAPSGTALSVDPATGAVSFTQGRAGAAGVGKPLTEAQSKDNVFATRAEGALQALEGGNETALTSRRDAILEMGPMGVGRDFQSPEYQTARQSGDEFLQAILRKDTGAAITAPEQELYGKTYLPQPGDGPAVLQAKRASRARAVEALRSGMSADQVAQTEQALIEAARRLDGGSTGTPAPETAKRKKYNPATGRLE